MLYTDMSNKIYLAFLDAMSAFQLIKKSQLRKFKLKNKIK